MSQSDQVEENSGAENVMEEKGSDDTDISVSVTQTLPTIASGKLPSRKKRRSNDGLESGLANLAKAFGSYIEHRKELMNMLVKRIGYDQDASQDRRRTDEFI